MFSFCSRVVSSTSSTLRSFSTSSVLASTKKGGGSSKNNRNSAGKRLGVKKYHGELVQPGSIIMRQRGFKIHPGQHVTWGRDHTLTSLIPGFVKFYKMPYNRKKGSISPNIPNALPRGLNWDPPLPPTNMPKGYRSYVGVTFNKEDVLPRDEKGLGRERIFLGRVEEGEKRTGVYEFEAREVEVDLEAGEEKVTKGMFQERQAKKIAIPSVPGRVVNGEIVPAEVVRAEESSSAAAASL